MKSEEIQDLLSFIASSGLDEVNIETENLKLSVKRSATVVQMQAPAAAVPVAALTAAASAAPAAAALPAAPAPVADLNLVTQRSPMIGTFYASASPDQPPLVQVGDEVQKGQVICIIEAMKLFNEIESDYAGRVMQIVVQNATPVEYDQPLFIIQAK